MIAGLEEIAEFYIDGKFMNDVGAKRQRYRNGIQNHAPYPAATVLIMAAFGLKLRKVPKDEIKRKVKSQDPTW